MLSAPPARPKSASPSISDCTTETIACAPDPHSRLTFIAGVVSGMPASIAATRLRYMSRGSVLMTWPNDHMADLPALDAGPLQRGPCRRLRPASIGGVAASAPPKVPMAVRAAPRMTISVMVQSSSLWFAPTIETRRGARQSRQTAENDDPASRIW